MFLKEVILEGFKSFSDKTSLKFNENLTAIVGPNGSGKSNVVDAIQWVMGELSAKTLRGSKMSDLIFAGSSKRKAVNDAQVTLIFDNGDGAFPCGNNPVSVARKINREGGSFYFINGESCRLKDLENFLIEGGIHKDTSAILGQGKIETLLMSKATDRRELFEEAAGIIKYKMRKNEALNKMESTSSQIRRVRDIIHEVNRQARPLKKQMTIAKEYLVIEEELKRLEVNLLLVKIEENARGAHGLLDEIERQEGAVSQNKSSLEVNEETVLAIASELKILDEKIDLNRELSYKAQNKVEMLQTKISMNQERSLDYEEEKKKNLLRKEELKALIEKKEKEFQSQNQELLKAKEELANLESRLESFVKGEEKNIQRWEELNKKKEYYQESLKDLLAKNTKQREELQENEEQATRLETRIQEVESLKEETNKERLSFLPQEAALEEDIKVKKDTYQGYQEMMAQKAEKLSGLQEKQKILELEERALEGEFNSASNQLELLKKYREEDLGFSPGVKAILTQSKEKKLQGIHGVVAELYQTSDKFAEAIAIALGGRRQNIIVENSQDAEKAIEYLKKANAGRVTFLPLNMVKPRSINPSQKSVLEHPGVYGLAIDLIEYDQAFHNAFGHLLASVLIVEDLKIAVDVSSKTNNRLLVVTLEGDLINPGGAITGGARRNHRETTRKNTILNLEEKTRKIRVKLTSLGQEKMQINQDIASEIEALEDLRRDLTQSEILLRDREKDLALALESEAKLIISLNQLEERSQGLQYELEKVINNINKGQENFLVDQRKYQKEKEEAQIVDGQIEDLRLEIGDIQGQLMDMRVELAAKGHECQHLEQICKQLKIDLDSARTEIKEKEKENSELARLKDNYLNEIDIFKENIETLSKEKIAADKELDFSRQQKQKQQEVLLVQESKLAELKKAHFALESNLNELKLKEDRLVNEEERMKERLLFEYELSIEQARGLQDKELDLSDAQMKINKLRSRKKALEPVNLGAIEEYKELSERLSFMKEQHKDLTQAQDTLNKIIASIDKTMEDKFLRTFNEVAKEFESIFKKLFQGGKAELYLANPDNLLETGIEVVSQPPGKNLQKLSLMSGGEKALTAIALLFAVLRVRPCPFYILDEIDAPLDEANVDRFNLFLREYSDLSQFIVITHRKRSIAEADTIYGVTMEEAGVSTIISYKLKEKAS